jgi:hypothetical protein
MAWDTTGSIVLLKASGRCTRKMPESCPFRGLRCDWGFDLRVDVVSNDGGSGALNWGFRRP